MWDVHCTVKLERWQQRFGRGARDWFLALGAVEGLSSLSGLAFDEPQFCFPKLVPEARLLAEGLAHPLIPAGVRVGNDLSLPGPGSALLVTGSNMSGKSTLLRAIGVAYALACSGGPVCATRLELGACCYYHLASATRSRGRHPFYADLHSSRRSRREE